MSNNIKSESEIRLEILNTAVSLASDIHYQKIEKAKLIAGDNQVFDIPEDTRIQDALKSAKRMSKFVFGDDSKELLVEEKR